jgi:type VI secretion system protein ImpH
VSARYRLDENAECFLDPGPADSRRLGQGAVVGDEIREPQARVRIVIGPLPLSRRLNFQSSGKAFAPLRPTTDLFSGDQIDFELQSILDRQATPHCELGAEGGSAPQRIPEMGQIQAHRPRSRRLNSRALIRRKPTCQLT